MRDVQKGSIQRWVGLMEWSGMTKSNSMSGLEEVMQLVEALLKNSVDVLEMGSKSVGHFGFIKSSDLVNERLRVGDSRPRLHGCGRGVGMDRVMRAGGGADRERAWPHGG